MEFNTYVTDKKNKIKKTIPSKYFFTKHKWYYIAYRVRSFLNKFMDIF